MNEVHEACACLGTCHKWPFTCSGIPRWISFKEGKPSECQRILIHRMHVPSKKHSVDEVYWDEEIWEIAKDWEVLHWMRMPEFPI